MTDLDDLYDLIAAPRPHLGVLDVLLYGRRPPALPKISGVMRMPWSAIAILSPPTPWAAKQHV